LGNETKKNFLLKKFLKTVEKMFEMLNWVCSKQLLALFLQIEITLETKLKLNKFLQNTAVIQTAVVQTNT
jgi:hypothetical protein